METNVLSTVMNKVKSNMEYDKIIALVEHYTDDKEVDYIEISKKCKYASEEYNSIKQQIKSAGKTVILISEKKYMMIVNRIIWECENASTLIYIDLDNPYEVEAPVTATDKLLWDVQANKAGEDDQAMMSGWNNSYNNQPFTEEELFEYISDSKLKLEPYLGNDTEVLEVGVGSGMIAFEIIPNCKSYDGCDISNIVLDRLRTLCEKKHITNLNLYNLGADEINKIGKQYDIILMSSVTEYFGGYNYLRNVVQTCIDTCKTCGHILFADVFDLDMKEEYESSIMEYAATHPECHNKRGFTRELFVPKAYWHDLIFTMPDIANIEVTNKIGVIDNEINKYRYDVMITVDKTSHTLHNKTIYNKKPVKNFYGKNVLQ